MSSKRFSKHANSLPEWYWEYLGIPPVAEGKCFMLGDAEFIVSNGIPRFVSLYSPAQSQTEETFGFKWKKRDTFDSPGSLKRIRDWLTEKYGNVVDEDWFSAMGDRPLVLDAGCGAGVSGLEVFGGAGSRVRYLGVDISTAVEVAQARFLEKGLEAGFIQADISKLPFRQSSVDIIFSEGVLHHTDSTEEAFKALAPLLRPGGYFMFYVYRRKGPVREFTDDYVRDRLQFMPPEEAWLAMEPLTQLGISLGKLNLEIDIPKSIDLLDIPAGKINIQRLFYWHVAKAFYHPDLSFDEMNHINYDWYAPANAHRHSPEEVKGWCEDAGLVVKREVVEEAGITIIARKSN